MKNHHNDMKQENEKEDATESEFESHNTQNLEKGTRCERAVIREADQKGHIILVEHSENPSARGFDCVSFEPLKKELHIWEAKNMPSRDVRNGDLTAWQDTDLEGNARKGYRYNWSDIINSVPEGQVRDVITAAVNEGRVYFHLRITPETEISTSLKKLLDELRVPGAHYDWRQYRPEDM